ncbi:TIGR03757 family integrating conjugative element protein [Pseudomonas nitroreducens]|uniref:TIGR03757 family integrating conjugative element protein n=1 Tax=Pseudomonas nitroreducens TaxID=46680 RepID=UPI0028AE09D6|nr:TIGR03757 family integrating conjugative element protein [Pseudomonas nitroreducens]
MLNFSRIGQWRAVAVLCGAIATGTTHAETWVITDSAHPVTLPAGAGIRLIQLDEQQRLEEQLSRLLPANPQQAAAAAQKILNGPEGTRIQRDLLEAQQGVTDAWSVGVEKLPAVVVDRKYVVYGQPNVALALQAIEHSRSVR